MFPLLAPEPQLGKARKGERERGGLTGLPPARMDLGRSDLRPHWEQKLGEDGSSPSSDARSGSAEAPRSEKWRNPHKRFN